MSCHAAAPPTPAPSGRARAVSGPAMGGVDDAPLVVLVGNPNVGKSTLFNALTGAHQTVTNAPGTTVQVQLGQWRTAGDADPVRLADLPGTYSLVARSPDERVAEQAVSGDGSLGVPAVAVVVVEAASLARSLYLLGQVAERGCGVIVALTMLDVATSRGVDVPADRLAEVLGIPVIPVDPRTGAGRGRLATEVARAVREGAPHVRFEAAGPVLGPVGRADRRLGPVGPTIASAVEAGPGASVAAAEPGTTDDELARADRMFSWVEDVVGQVTPQAGEPVRWTWSDRLDRLLLDPWIGLPVFLAVMWAMFQLATTLAAPLVDGIGWLVSGPVADAVRTLVPGPGWLQGMLVDGVLAGVGTVVSFAPVMALIFGALALLEDSGYLARAAFVADKAMRAIGLDGRAMLPLVVGFGCNVPALAATRTLPNARQRLLTGLLVPYTSCTARLTVYVLLAGAFFPDAAGTVIFCMYLLSLVLVVVAGLVLRGTLFRDLRREPLVLALPAYQRPRVGAVLRSTWLRVRGFLERAGKVIVVTLTIVWALLAVPVGGGHPVGDVPVADSLYGAAAQAVAPVLGPAGLDDWHVSAALLTGFVAKEVVVGSFAQTYAVADPADPADPADRAAPGGLGDRLQASLERSSGGAPGAAAVAFMVLVLAYTPCLATLAEQRRLFGNRWTSGALAVQLVVAWLLAVAVFQVGRLL